MMKNENKMFWDSAVAVSMTCSDLPRPDSNAHPADVAEYLSEILSSSVGCGNEPFYVFPMRYPEASKKPYLIFDKKGHVRLLWYYPHQSDERLRDDLSEVLVELVGEHIRASA